MQNQVTQLNQALEQSRQEVCPPSGWNSDAHHVLKSMEFQNRSAAFEGELNALRQTVAQLQTALETTSRQLATERGIFTQAEAKLQVCAKKKGGGGGGRARARSVSPTYLVRNAPACAFLLAVACTLPICYYFNMPHYPYRDCFRFGSSHTHSPFLSPPAPSCADEREHREAAGREDSAYGRGALASPPRVQRAWRPVGAPPRGAHASRSPTRAGLRLRALSSSRDACYAVSRYWLRFGSSHRSLTLPRLREGAERGQGRRGIIPSIHTRRTPITALAARCSGHMRFSLTRAQFRLLCSLDPRHPNPTLLPLLSLALPISPAQEQAVSERRAHELEDATAQLEALRHATDVQARQWEAEREALTRKAADAQKKLERTTQLMQAQASTLGGARFCY